MNTSNAPTIIASNSAAHSLLDLGRVLLVRRHLVTRPIVAVVVLVVLITLLLPRTFTSGATFTPQSPEANLSRLSGLAAQFGVNVPQGGANASPDFYAELLKMPSLLGELVTRRYQFPKGSGAPSGNLITLFGISQPDTPKAREEAIRKLSRSIDVATQARTGIVSFHVQTRWPDVSRSIADSLLRLVNTFNLETRQTQAANERRFIESRLGEAKGELRDAENSMMAFLLKNRDFRSAPALLFEHDRRQRELALRQGIVSALTQSFETARLDEVRNTPVITVLERPQLPAEPDSRQLPLRIVLAVVLGGIIGVLLALAAEYAANGQRSDPTSFDELSTVLVSNARDLRRPWRLLSPP